MNATRTTAGLLSPPDPPQDWCGRLLPPATAERLIVVQVLLVYARYLFDTLGRLAGRGFSLMAQCSGSTQAAFVLANLTRGILRAIALERVLLARVGGAPDPVARRPRKHTSSAASDVQQPAGQQPSGVRPAPDLLAGLPTLRQLEAAIRRRPERCAIDDICHDIGIAFSLCEDRFGNALRDMIAAYRDNLSNVFKQCLGRTAVAADAPERDFAFDLPPQKPDAIRYIVGCFIGAPRPVCGFPFTAPPIGAATAGAQPR